MSVDNEMDGTNTCGESMFKNDDLLGEVKRQFRDPGGLQRKRNTCFVTEGA